VCHSLPDFFQNTGLISLFDLEVEVLAIALQNLFEVIVRSFVRLSSA
jgi:hypothetical protein